MAYDRRPKGEEDDLKFSMTFSQAVLAPRARGGLRGHIRRSGESMCLQRSKRILGTGVIS